MLYCIETEFTANYKVHQIVYIAMSVSEIIYWYNNPESEISFLVLPSLFIDIDIFHFLA